MSEILKKFEEWFESFQIARIVKNPPQRIDGRALYSYQLETEEFRRLRALFSGYYRGLTARNSKLNQYYGAAFVLLGSEFYRREYQRNWSWAAIEQFIGLSYDSTDDRSELIELGFNFWKLPEIESEPGKNRDFLGGVLRQGGLPWKLVQDRNDSLGRVIQHLFTNYASLMRESGSLELGLMHYLDKYSIPEYQRNDYTYQLLMGVVESVIRLQKKYPDLDKVLDPTLYLNEHEPTWIYEFPLPLDEENASTLLKEWFKDAKAQIDEQKQGEENRSNHFISEFYWNNSLDFTDQLTEAMISKIYPPSSMAINLEALKAKPTTFRLELLIYEGDLPIAKGKIVYAQKNDAGDLVINFKQLIANAFSVKRRNLEEVLIIKLMSGGISIYEETIEGSALSSIKSPLFLIAEENKHYKLLSDNGSFSTKHSRGFLYVPDAFEILDKVPSSDLEELPYTILFKGEKARWVEVADTVTIEEVTDASNQYFFEVNSDDPSKAIHLIGSEALEYRGRSSRYIYRGFPRLKNAPEHVFEYVNGKLLRNIDRETIIGNVNYQAKTADGKILITRRFAVIPRDIDFQTEVVSFSSNTHETTIKAYQKIGSSKREDGSISFGLRDLPASIAAEKLEEGGYHLTLHDIDTLPDGVIVEVFSSHHSDPLLISVPFYLSGIRLQKDGRLLPIKRELSFSLDELIGHEIVIQDKQDIRNIEVSLALHTKYYKDVTAPLKAYSQLKQMQQRVVLSLYGFKEEIERFFAIVDDLDANVVLELSIPRLREFIKIRISRFHISGNLHDVVPQLTLDINGIDEKCIGSLELQWLSLVNPSNKIDFTYSRTLPQGNLPTGHPVTRVSCSEDLKYEPLGLIISKEQSRYNLRPILAFNPNAMAKSSFEKGTIERAVIDYHPVENTGAFDHVFLAMLKDLEHAGWQYFKALVEDAPDTLSLSTFAAWKMLVKNPDLLTLLFFKLNLTVEFCERIRNELSVIWEAIPFECWRNAWGLYYSSLGAKLGDNYNIKIMVPIFNGYIAKLTLLMPVFNLLRDYIHKGTTTGFLEHDSDVEASLRVPKNNLIAGNDNRTWPTFLQQEFGYWLKNLKEEHQVLSDGFYRFLISSEDPSYRYSSLILPVYMAAIAANRGKFLDITDFISREVNHNQSDEILEGWMEAAPYIKDEQEQLIKLKFIYQQISHFDYEWYEKCFHYALADLLAS